MKPTLIVALPLVASAAGLVGGWLAAWWLHHRTAAHWRTQASAAAAAVTAGLALCAAGSTLWWPALLAGLPLLTGGAMLGRFAWMFHRKALGAGGELRQFELARDRDLRTALARRRRERANGERTVIATQGELHRTRQVKADTIPLDTAGRLKVAVGPGQHTLVVGRTGFGKTRTIERIVAYRARAGSAIITLDPKPDPELAEYLAAVAGKLGRPFYLVDPSHPGSVPITRSRRRRRVRRPIWRSRATSSPSHTTGQRWPCISTRSPARFTRGMVS